MTTLIRPDFQPWIHVLTQQQNHLYSKCGQKTRRDTHKKPAGTHLSGEHHQPEY